MLAWQILYGHPVLRISWSDRLRFSPKSTMGVRPLLAFHPLPAVHALRESQEIKSGGA